VLLLLLLLDYVRFLHILVYAVYTT
jgi:hypothetical protein